MSATQRYDLYSHDFRLATHETYARMREESPVHRQPGLDGETPIWFVTRYDDVVALLSDNERFVVDPTLALTPDELAALHEGGPEPDERVNENLLGKDGDDHRRLRRLVTKAFTPRMVEQLRPRIQEIADELIDRVAGRGHMELVDDFAFPLPITVIAELLGIPVEDQGRFRVWSNSFVLPPMTPELQEQLARHTDEFVEYLDELFASTSRRADRGPRERARPGRGRGRPPLRERAVQHGRAPDRRRARDDREPDHERSARVADAPRAARRAPCGPRICCRRPSRSFSASTARWSARSRAGRLPTSSWAAAAIARGDLVIAVVGSANRDAEQFPNADTLDLGRAENKHVGFGRGPHYCLGAPLARLETEIAVETLLRRLPNLRLTITEDDLYWRPIPLFRSLAELPVAWDVRWSMPRSRASGRARSWHRPSKAVRAPRWPR